MNLDIQIAHSVEQIGQAAWDYLAEGRPFSSYRWYRYGETVLADNKPIYVILSHHGEPVARATFWLRWREALPLSSRIVRRALEALIRRRPLLMCQAPVSDAPGMILPAGELREAALRVMAQVAQDQAHAYRASFLAWLYLQEYDAWCAGWPDAFARVRMDEPLTRLAIMWPDFESYVRQLPKSARGDYRRHCRHAAEQGIEVRHQRLSEEEPLSEGLLDEAVALLGNVEERHKSAHNPWARAMLQHAVLVDAVWLRAESGDRLVGCGLLLGDGDVWVMTLLGLDYGVRYAYFQLMYAAIRCAIEQGARVLWGGASAYELKRRLGFQVQPRHFVVFAAGRKWLQTVGQWVAQRGTATRAEAHQD